MKFLFPLCLSACATILPSDIASDAQKRLGDVRPKIETMLLQYEKDVEARVEYCREQDIETPEDRTECLGDVAPDSQYSQAIRIIRVTYDNSAVSLNDLRTTLILIETYQRKLQQ